MEDSRTKPHHHSSGKRHHRERPHHTGSSSKTDMGSISPPASDTKSCGAGLSREPRSESTNSRIRALQEHLAPDSRGAHSQRQAGKGPEKHESVEKDFMKYLGLAEGSADNAWSRRRSATKADQKSNCQTSDLLGSCTAAGGSHHASYAASLQMHPPAPPLNTLPPAGPPTPPLPPPPPPPPPIMASPPGSLSQHQQPLHQQLQSDNFEDFKKYLGLSEGSNDNFWSRRRAVAKASQKSSHSMQSDRLSSSTNTAPVSHHVRYAASLHSQSSSPQFNNTLPPVGPQSPPQQHQHHQQNQQYHHQHQMTDEFADEQSFFQMVEQMLTHAEKTCVGRFHLYDAEAVVASLRRFSGEFGDSVCHFHRKRPDAFPFYQPEMLKMLDLLNGTFLASTSDLEVFSEQLRSIHLSMRLFLLPADTLAEVDDAALTRLLLAYSEQLDRDLRSLPLGGGGSAAAAPEAIRYARRRAAALAAAVGRYARTVERRRQLVLGRMQSLAATVMGFVARCPPSGSGSCGSGSGTGEGAFRKAVVDLFDDMLACFSSLGGSSLGSCSAFAGSSAELPIGRRSRAVSPTVNSEDGFAGGCGDTMSASSRFLPPPPPSVILPQPSDNEEAASVASVDIDGVGNNNGGGLGVEGRGDTVKDDEEACDLACSPDASASANSTTVGPLEALSLQLMERLTSMLSSFLPNERVNNQEFKSGFVALHDWWRRAIVGCVGTSGTNAIDRRVTSRMAVIREQFNCTQRHRADSSGLKRLCSEADTAWDLIEVAKLMIPADERCSALMSAHTAPEMREATASLVDSVLATLFLYQTAQDASVLSTRLRADLHRLINRLAECGPVPLLCLLRLRIMYLRARQYSDLLRAHPQGCLILELAQTHRIFRRYEYPDGSVPLSLTVCVPLNDYQKFCQHIKDMRVISFEARAPVTEKTSLLMKASCLKKIEKCCQCTIELQQPSSSSATSGSTSASPMATSATGGSSSTVATPQAEDAMTMGGRRKPQLVVGSARPNFGLVIRPEASNGRANAAMRMINDIVGPASIGDRVKYCRFHLSVAMPANYRPLTIFADTSRPLSC